MYKGQRHAL